MATYSTNFGYQIATVLVVTALMGWGLPVVAKEKPHDPSRSKRVVLDHDGAFEDFYAALESQRNHPSIRLIAVTLSPVGEAYCPGSNGFPDQKEESIGDLTEKVLSIAGYAAPIYSGCGESRGTVTVDEIMEDTFSPTGKTLEFQVELPLGGQMALEPCRHHVEVPFFPAPELQCYYEFPKRFR